MIFPPKEYGEISVFLKKCNCNSSKNLVFTLRKNTRTYIMDQLFLLPARVLAMDSLSFREDVASVAPDFFSSHHLKNSPPHNSLDSTDSNRSSVRVLEDTEGLVFARASNGCLWLCKCSPLFAYSLTPIQEAKIRKKNCNLGKPHWLPQCFWIFFRMNWYRRGPAE